VGTEIYKEIRKEKDNTRVQAEKEREEMLKNKPVTMPVAESNPMMIRVNRAK
jgi:hypothetical protein